MTLAEALKIVHIAPRDGERFGAMLACGFTPLYFGTFLCAHLEPRLPGRAVKIPNGLSGGRLGTLSGSRDHCDQVFGLLLREAADFGASAVKGGVNLVPVSYFTPKSTTQYSKAELRFQA